MAKATRGVSVVQLPSGSYRVTVAFGGQTVKRTRKTQEAARAKGLEILANLKEGRPAEGFDEGLGHFDALEPFLESREKKGQVPDHIAEARRILSGALGACPNLASPLAPRLLEAHLDAVVGDKAPATYNRYIAQVRAYCRWLMRRDGLAKDPTLPIERKQVEDHLKPQFEIDEVRHLVADAVGDPYWLTWCLLAYTGCRAGEVMGLRWSDIRFASGVILVREYEGHRIKRRRERVVPLLEELRAVLAMVERPPNPDAVVVSGASTNFRRPFRAFLARHHVPLDGRSPHSTRHTYAGVMTATGVPGALLGSWLGHSTAATTQHYAKLAARYYETAKDWGLGVLRYAEGASSPWGEAEPLRGGGNAQPATEKTEQPPTENADDLIGIQEIRAKAGKRLAVVQEAVRSGALPVAKRGPRRKALIRRGDADKWIASLE